MNMKGKLIVVIVLVALGAFFVLNKYIYNEKQADVAVGATIEKSGHILSVDLSQAAFDGPYLLILDAGGELFTIAVPSMGLPFCAAYTNRNIGDVSLFKAGDEVEVKGILSEEGQIVPCESGEHYLRPTPLVVENFEGEADPSRMTLGMKKWVWQSALYNDGRVVKPMRPDAFTLSFDGKGNFSATTDCNGVGGSYSTSGNSLTFGQMMSTLMYCEGSQESEFTELLSNTDSYLFTSKGELVLNLKFDSGSVTFR